MRDMLLRRGINLVAAESAATRYSYVYSTLQCIVGLQHGNGKVNEQKCGNAGTIK